MDNCRQPRDEEIELDTLKLALAMKFGKSIIRADYQSKQVHGGTLGDVRLVEGTAESESGETLPYQIIWKKQKKWARPGDPNSWRREYDLYQSRLAEAFNPTLRWPHCYHSLLRDNEIELWLEYIEGVSGESLTIEMLELAALELGRFQGRISTLPDFGSLPCLGDKGFMAREFSQWHTQTFSLEQLVSESCPIPEFLKQMLRSGEIQLIEGKSFEYSYLRSKACDLPQDLKNMLMDIDERQDELFDKLSKLPVVLCHRDYWIENIFYVNGAVRLIDWDTAGWGYLGEDMASLIVDEMPVERFKDNMQRLLPAYRKGLAEYMPVPVLDETCILDMILIKFAYRMMQEHMFSDRNSGHTWGLNALREIRKMLKA